MPTVNIYHCYLQEVNQQQRKVKHTHGGGEISWPTFYVTVNSKSDSKIEACETIAVHAHAIYAN